MTTSLGFNIAACCLGLLAQLFRQPMYIPTLAISLIWSLPICLSISLVYKAIKVEKFEPVGYLREVGLLFVTVVGFLALVAVILWIIESLVN